jgi:hypothetical protein
MNLQGRGMHLILWVELRVVESQIITREYDNIFLISYSVDMRFRNDKYI